MPTISVTAKPIRAQATQWHTHGDHPRVTRAHKNPKLGWIWTELGGQCVVPGSWIVEHANHYEVLLEPDFHKFWQLEQNTKPTLKYYQDLSQLHNSLA